MSRAYKDPTAEAAMGQCKNFTAPNHGILRVELPLPPSVNHYYVNVTIKGRRMRVLSARAEAWMHEARQLLMLAARAHGWHESVGRKTVMRIWTRWPDGRRRDTGNLHKALGDAPEGIIYRDDHMLLLRDMDWQVDRKRAGVTVEFEEV